MPLKRTRVYIAILIILLLALTTVTVYSITTETRHTHTVAAQEKLVAVAAAAASQVDGDTFARLQPGEEGTPAFLGIRNQLAAVKRDVPDVLYIYTLKRNGTGVDFVVDGDYGSAPDTPGIGVPYPEAEPELFAGFDGLSADNDFTTDKWGTVLSGFAPIRDHTGSVVGIVGVDMDSTVVAAELDYLDRLYYLIAFLAMAATILGIIYFERRRIAAEQMVAESEKKYRLLFEQAADAIFLIEADGEKQGTIISANQAAADMHGYTTRELEGRPITDLLAPPALEEAAGQIAAIRSGGWQYGENLHKKRDGSLFPVEYSTGMLTLGEKTCILVIDHDISERKKSGDALEQVTRKLALLNAVTFNDIQNAVFTLNGFITYAQTLSPDEDMARSLLRADQSVRRIVRCLDFARNYQDLGVRPPRWQDVNRVFILGISHLDFSNIERSVQLDGLEIYADSLLERVFYTLADNVLRHAKTATRVTLGYVFSGDDLVLFFQDNGQGIPEEIKEKIFTRGFGSQKGMELFLIREVLSITGITIRENGTPGRCARFEIIVPRGMYRFPGRPAGKD